MAASITDIMSVLQNAVIALGKIQNTLTTGLPTITFPLAAANGGTGSTIQFMPQGQCKLALVSATQIKLSPYNGFDLLVNGVMFSIPAAGITAANTSVFVNGVAGQNLAALTLYYVYIFSNAGTLTVDFSTTSYATDVSTVGNIGVQIKSGDATRTLVGMIRTNAASQFVDSATQRFVRSWFHNYGVGSYASTLGATTASATFVEVSGGARCELLTWANEFSTANVSVSCYNAIAANNIDTAIGVDSTTSPSAVTNVAQPAGSANLDLIMSVTYSAAFSEGYHFFTILGRSLNVSNASWQSGLGHITVTTCR